MTPDRRDILLIHHRLPYPTHSGMDKARFSLIKILNQEFRVTLIVLGSNDLKETDIYEVRRICSELLIINEERSSIFKNKIFKKLRTLFLILGSFFFHKPVFVSNYYSRKFKGEIKQLLKFRKFDIVQPLSDFTMNYAIGLNVNSCKFFGPNDDMVGMTISILSVTESKVKRQLLQIELRARIKWQEKMIRKSDNAFYFSKNDINNITTRNPALKEKLIWMPGVVENKSEWNESSIYSVEKNTLVFTGNLISEFNRKSIVYFFKTILPLIIKEISDVKIYIVGQIPGDYFIERYSFPNVIYTDKVQDVQPYLERAAVFISPVICGTGIKTKIIEAMRFGKPIVSTPEGVSGLWEYPSDAIKIKSNPLDFSREVIKLLKDEEYRINTCLKSRNLFEKHYSFEVLAPRIYEIYKDIL